MGSFDLRVNKRSSRFKVFIKKCLPKHPRKGKEERVEVENQNPREETITKREGEKGKKVAKRENKLVKLPQHYLDNFYLLFMSSLLRDQIFCHHTFVSCFT